jgi:hypothetical protein
MELWPQSSHLFHHPGGGVWCDGHSFAPQLLPDFPHAIGQKISNPYPADLPSQLDVPPGTRRQTLPIEMVGGLLMTG